MLYSLVTLTTGYVYITWEQVVFIVYMPAWLQIYKRNLFPYNDRVKSSMSNYTSTQVNNEYL